MSLSTSIREFLDALVHPSARHDPLTAERHVAFMASRLFGSLLALGVFPVFLAWHGVPSALDRAASIACAPAKTAPDESRHHAQDGES